MQRRTVLAALAALAVATVASTPPARAASGSVEQAKLIAPDGAPGDRLGDVVAVDGDTVVAGAPLDDDAGPASGSAHVFALGPTGWAHQAKLTASNAASIDRFGVAVAVDGDTILVGANQGDGLALDTGAAYVFVRSGTTWTEQAVLAADDGAADDFFGDAVALEGDLAFVGAPRDDDRGSWSGSVYVFARTGTTWNQVQKLTASDGWIDDAFGTSLSVDAGRLAVGAEALIQPGKAYVFAPSGGVWTERAALGSWNGHFSDRFGHAIALSGDTLAVSAKGIQDSSVYVFRLGGATWSALQQVRAVGVRRSDTFGSSVALDGDLLAVGAQGDDVLGASAGAVYVFQRERDAFRERFRVHAGDGQAQARFGESAALQGQRLVVGALQDSNANGGEAGAAYVLRLRTPPSLYCAGKPSSLGCVPFVTTWGFPSESDPTPFRVTAVDVVPRQPGVLLYALGRADLDWHGGTLCLEAPLAALPARSPENPGGGCSGWTLRADFNARIQSGSDPLLTAGQRVHAQWRQRDPADPTGHGDALTDAVAFVVAP